MAKRITPKPATEGWIVYQVLDPEGRPFGCPRHRAYDARRWAAAQFGGWKKAFHFGWRVQRYFLRFE